MTHDSDLAERIRAKMAGMPSVEEKEMFDGIGFLVNGNLVCGVHENEMIVRIDREKYHDIEVNIPFARPFAIEGRPVGDWMAIAPEGLRDDEEIDRWIKEGVESASSHSNKGT